jgi:hypothetical protein
MAHCPGTVGGMLVFPVFPHQSIPSFHCVPSYIDR